MRAPHDGRWLSPDEALGWISAWLGHSLQSEDVEIAFRHAHDAADYPVSFPVFARIARARLKATPPCAGGDGFRVGGTRLLPPAEGVRYFSTPFTFPHVRAAV